MHDILQVRALRSLRSYRQDAVEATHVFHTVSGRFEEPRTGTECPDRGLFDLSRDQAVALPIRGPESVQCSVPSIAVNSPVADQERASTAGVSPTAAIGYLQDVRRGFHPPPLRSKVLLFPLRRPVAIPLWQEGGASAGSTASPAGCSSVSCDSVRVVQNPDCETEAAVRVRLIRPSSPTGCLSTGSHRTALHGRRRRPLESPLAVLVLQHGTSRDVDRTRCSDCSSRQSLLVGRFSRLTTSSTTRNGRTGNTRPAVVVPFYNPV